MRITLLVMNMSFHRLVFAPLFAAALFTALPAGAQQLEKSMEQGIIPVTKDFVLGPTQFDLSLKPGAKQTVQLFIVNRQGETANYSILSEDFSAGEFQDERVHLYGKENGPYSAKDWLSTPVKTFQLRHGERATIPVTVSIPQNADAGDHYGALIIQRENTKKATGSTRVDVLSRIGSLFLLKVEGKVIENGQINAFKPLHTVYWTYPVIFSLTGKNEGSVRMSVSGSFLITNAFGSLVDTAPVSNWTILRNSTNTRAFPWKPQFALGRYNVTADIALFPDQSPLEFQTSVWVFPLLPIILILLVVFAAGSILNRIRRKFSIVVRQKGK